jgi:hypothetical protein
MHVGRLRGFRPVDSILNRNSVLFYLLLNLNSKSKNSYLSLQSSKNNETSSVGFIIL